MARWLSRSNLGRRWCAILAGITGVTLLATTAGCGSQSADNLHHRKLRAGTISVPTSEPPGWSVSYPISLPAGYGTPTGLAIDPANGDVWFYAGGPDQRLFRWSQSQAKIADSYQIDNTDPATQAGQFTPIAIDSTGRAWIGINQTILLATPGQTDLEQVKLPTVKIGAADSGLPHPSIPNFGEHAPIDAIAVGPDGTVVTARMFATELQTIRPSTLAVSTVPIPDGAAVSGLGADDLAGNANEIAAALYTSDRRDELGQLVKGTWTKTSPCTGIDSVITSNQTIAVAGENCIAAGTISPGSGPEPLAPVTMSGLPEKPSVAILSDTTIMATVPGGLVASTSGRQTPIISLGRVAAGTTIGGNQSADPNRLVPVRPLLMRSDPKGRLYFVAANNNQIGLVQQTS